MYTLILIKNHASFVKLCEKDWYTGTRVNKILVVKYELLRYRSNWQILHNRIISFIVLSSDNTNCKNDIQLFHQLFDELSVYRDYH